MKTMAIRLEDDLHARLSLVAQLQGSTITEEIRQAIEHHIERIRSNPELTAKAGAVLEELERDAAARRDAVAALFGTNEPEQAPSPPKPPTRRTK